MKFVILYEVPPMRGFFQTLLNADNKKEAKEKFHKIYNAENYRIKEIKEYFLEHISNENNS